MQAEAKKAELEIKKLERKLYFDEHGATKQITTRIKEVDEDLTDVRKEIKLLRRLQYH